MGGGGMGRRGGMGGGQRQPTNDDGSSSVTPPNLKLRWESALPVREAELKARETGAPTVDEGHYAVAVYGVPNRMAPGDAKTLAAQLKKQATLKRDGKKDIKPSSVEVFPGEDGPVIFTCSRGPRKLLRMTGASFSTRRSDGSSSHSLSTPKTWFTRARLNCKLRRCALSFRF